MPSNKNKVIIASAGSRKTTCLVEEALKIKDKRVLLTTYTNENVDQINSYLIQQNGFVPSNIIVLSWFSFLLQDGVRPYQNMMTERGRITTINFLPRPDSLRYVGKKNDAYFLTQANDIYKDHVADFVCECDSMSKGLVVNRMSKIYSHIFIDEMQDLSAHDLDLLEKLFRSPIAVLVVGDPRQATFSTSNSCKNKAFKGSLIGGWVAKMQKQALISVESKTDCYRSIQAICDFADKLFPELPKSVSKNNCKTDHDGIFTVNKSEVEIYYNEHNPTVFRHDVKTDTKGLPAINIGLTKGRTYEHVLIFPTKPMKDYLLSKVPLTSLKPGALSRLYVAVTRAKQSVCFVVD